MAHWVGVINQPEKEIITGETKDRVIFEISVKMTGKTKFLTSHITQQLRNSRDKVAVAYGENPDDLIAKVFSCSCGSVIRHTRKPEE